MIQKENHSGFVAGTMVNTDKGLVPIQDIKIGDMVLASPELSTGAIRVYKRVVNTYQTASSEVWQLGVWFVKTVNDESELVRELFYLSKNSPVYLVESAWHEDRSSRWNKAGTLNPDDRVLLATADGESERYFVTVMKHVDTIGDNIGFCDQGKSDFDLNSFVEFFPNGSYETVHYWNIEGSFADGIFLGNFRPFDRDNDTDTKILEFGFKNRKFPTKNLTTPVFNLEVADFHTFFVGESGLWVHNSSTNIS